MDNEKKITKKHNLTYGDIEEIVEYLVKTKAYGYTFDCYTQDDIAQEIRIICFNALNKLDPERVKDGKLQNFFGRCVDNGLKNLKRDNYVRASSPYRKKFHALDENDKSEEAEEIREKFAHHQKGVKRKLAIRHATPIDGLAELINNKRFEKEMEYKDLERFLIEKASDDILVPLKLILSGRSKEVSRKEKRRVQQFVKNLGLS
jgi:hypothetical protein